MGVPAREGGGVPVLQGSKKGLRRGNGRGVPVQEGGGSCAGRGFLGGSWDSSCAGRGGFPMQEGGSWGVPGTVPMHERAGFLSGMHMPQPTHSAQFKPSNSPPLALPLLLTLGNQ